MLNAEHTDSVPVLSAAMCSPQAHLRLTDLCAHPGGEQQREEYQEHGSCSVLPYVCK